MPSFMPFLDLEAIRASASAIEGEDDEDGEDGTKGFEGDALANEQKVHM